MEYTLSSRDITPEDAAKIASPTRLSLVSLLALSGGKQSINRASAPSLGQIIADTKNFFKQQVGPETQAVARRSADLTAI
ncbi:enoyl- hydratase [Colletotrichum incanum]|uniref:Enoyl-hydratase n=1 Tax=Colletotrichum incanum TaxID=1573173 RepID=A0A166MRZ3_COLIC|nr:enoyl- hydratase [Colletotrichum incanum]